MQAIAAVICAIKRASEDAGIALPADTEISFADTPLSFSKRKVQKANAKPPKRVKDQPPLAAEPSADTGPEAEKPKLGELNEGIKTVPR